MVELMVVTVVQAVVLEITHLLALVTLEDILQ
jgi:hypothetical protein